MAGSAHEDRNVDLPCIKAGKQAAAVRFDTFDFDVGVLLTSAVESRGTSTFVSG